MSARILASNIVAHSNSIVHAVQEGPGHRAYRVCKADLVAAPKVTNPSTPTRRTTSFAELARTFHPEGRKVTVPTLATHTYTPVGNGSSSHRRMGSRLR